MNSPNEPLNATGTGEQAPPVDPSTTDAPTRTERRDQRTREALRATQAERDALRQRYEATVADQVLRQLDGRLTDPATVLRLAERSPADFVGADGTVDRAAVRAFAETFVAEHPAFRRGPASVSGANQRRVRSDEILSTERGAGWGDLLAARRGRPEQTG